jgi:hypothetical protein
VSSEGTGGEWPTPTALAAKAFMARIGGPSYQQTIRSRALNGGWAGSREAGCWDGKVSDAIAGAAVGAVMDLFRAWAAECDEPAAESLAAADLGDVCECPGTGQYAVTGSVLFCAGLNTGVCPACGIDRPLDLDGVVLSHRAVTSADPGTNPANLEIRESEI